MTFVIHFCVENNFYTRNVKSHIVMKKIYDRDCHSLNIKVTFTRLKRIFFAFTFEDSHLVLNRNVGSNGLQAARNAAFFSRAPELVFSAKPPTGSLRLAGSVWYALKRQTSASRNEASRGIFDTCSCKVHTSTVCTRLRLFFYSHRRCLWTSSVNSREWSDEDITRFFSLFHKVSFLRHKMKRASLSIRLDILQSIWTLAWSNHKLAITVS